MKKIQSIQSSWAGIGKAQQNHIKTLKSVYPEGVRISCKLGITDVKGRVVYHGTSHMDYQYLYIKNEKTKTIRQCNPIDEKQNVQIIE